MSEEKKSCNTCNFSCSEKETDICVKGGYSNWEAAKPRFPESVEVASDEVPANQPLDYAEEDIRSHNVGDSDYAKHSIQPWDIWLDYRLNPWDADIVKRVLRKKESQSRKMDYKKIIHICQERIRQLTEK
jgi:hypothetical protein